MAKLKVLVASRSRSAAANLAGILNNARTCKAELRVIDNGHADPLHGVERVPDALLLHYGPSRAELEHLATQGVRNNIPLIVCGSLDDPDAVRMAMRAGARDFLPEDVAATELLTSFERIREEVLQSRGPGAGKLIVVANGKGGSGASFIATNLAHSMVAEADKTATLFDLDVQFSGLHRYLDINPKVGLLQALEVAHEIDEISADGYTCAHASGLRLLAAPSKRLVKASELSSERIDMLIDAYLAINDYVVADAPSHLDSLTEQFFERADTIALVVQQSLPHVQDTARLLRILIHEFGVAKDRIGIVVNRYTKTAAVEIGDIRQALKHDRIMTVPNHYKIASECINSGIPLAEYSKSAAITKGIRNLRSLLSDPNAEMDSGIFKRALPNFLRG